MPPRKYRIALLVDDLEVDAWVYDLARRAHDHPAIELAAVIVEPRAAAKPIDRLLKLESRFLRRLGKRLNARRSIADCAPVQVLAGADGESAFDAIVHCSGPMPEGRLVNSAKDGLISIATTAGPLGRGGGFEEVLDGRPVTEFAIQRLKDGITEILFRGSITTQLFYSENRAALGERAAPYLWRAIEQLARGETSPREAVECAMTGEPRSTRSADILTYIGRTWGRVARKAWRHAMGREWNWGVAYSFAPWQRADLSSGHLLPKLPGTFVADPFVVEAAGKDYVFVEEFPYATRKGVISVFEVDEAGAARLGVAVEEPYHLSFPFVFRMGESFFMVPEGQGGGELVLYESEDFPLKWGRRKVLMQRVCADTVIFDHGGQWWMLTTIKGEGSAENSAELHAFHAEDPLGEWHPHRLNPIIMDASKGRNGGLLRDDDGNVYRVAQRADFRSYGSALAIYRIDQLTPDSYRESHVREIGPDFFPRLAGAHHMHSQGRLTVYDFYRDERP